MGPVVKVVALGVEAGVKIDCARRCGTCPECLCRKKDEIRRIGRERERERERERKKLCQTSKIFLVIYLLRPDLCFLE